MNPQDGIIYSYLIPYALAASRDLRAFAQSRLRRTSFQQRLQGLRRTIYINPDRDSYVWRFTDISWSIGPSPWLFDCVEIIANTSPKKVASDTGNGLRSPQFFWGFPALRRLLVRERETKLEGTII